MKTTHITASKRALLMSRYLAAVLTALMVAGGFCLWAATTVPFKGSAAGGIVNATPVPDGLLLTVLADGYATHLGQYSREEVVVLNPGAGTIAGTIVFTAANGDQLFGTVAAQFTSPTTIAGTYTFTGGTGRFENATGEVDALLFTPDGLNFTAEFEGSLSSVGSGKN